MSCIPAQAGADAIDAQLHAERLGDGGRSRRLHTAPLDDLPDGAFVLWDGEPALVLAARAARLAAGGLSRADASAAGAGRGR